MGNHDYWFSFRQFALARSAHIFIVVPIYGSSTFIPRSFCFLYCYIYSKNPKSYIEEILLPLYRQLGFHRITAAGHKDKALEFGKDIWMKFTLPTQHILYFGIQFKKGKLDSAGMSKSDNKNVAEIYNQALMMLGHEIFDPEHNRRVLVDHAFIVAGGEITKQAKAWLGNKLDAQKRSQIIFMDREDIINLFQ
ncbi:hypothetical protein ACJVDH_07520 [Pedobacter sp. AW1-32]|uniref:hypothetical protein n=1 Tax=Pedobacter sp. AW1-32 TaxID=3383026 RepID=UPI003FF0D875